MRSGPFQDRNGRWHGPDGRFIKVATAIAMKQKASPGRRHDAPGRGSLASVAARVAVAPSGSAVAKPQRTTMAVPEFAKPFHRNLDGIEDLAASVDDRRPPRSVRVLTGGVSAETELVELADGRMVVRKTAGHPDAEQAASMIGRALGLLAPRVYRENPGSVHMDYVDDALTFDQKKVRSEEPSSWIRSKALESDDGKRIALFDTLIANADRNGGNWMIASDGRVIPIDHGHAFMSAVVGSVGRVRPQPIALGPFAERAFQGGGRWVDHDFSPADIQEVRRRLEALRPDFRHINRERWLDYGLAVLDRLEPHAKGTRDLIAGTVAR